MKLPLNSRKHLKKLICFFSLLASFTLKAQVETTPPPLIYDSLSPYVNTCGNPSLWNFQNLNLSNYAAQEHDSDLVSLILPHTFRAQHPMLTQGDSVSGELPEKEYTVAGLSYEREGTYTAKYEAIGTLKLPNETFTNVFRLKITESYSYTGSQDSFCLKYMNVYNYFFVNEILKPILSYAEKTRKTCDGFLIEYYKEMTRPALDSINPNTNLNTLITNVNLTCNPNPASTASAISYNLPANGHVKLSLESALGNYQSLLENTGKTTGAYTTTINLTGLIPGIYYAKLQYAGVIFTKQLIIN